MSSEPERLIVVSNRLPFTVKRTDAGWRTERSSGGLASALGPVLQETRGLWIGWPGESPAVPDPAREDALAAFSRDQGFVTVDLTAEVAARFYEGYANQTLWPLFHQFPSSLVFDPDGWSAYVEANRRFCDVILAHARPQDLVWVHDYHLMLLPRMLRERAPSLRVGFFLHIPFPASEVFRILPHREDLLQGLLGADLLALQTHGDVEHLRSSLLRVLGIDSRMDRVEGSGGLPRLAALPIGIAPDELAALPDRDEGAARLLGEARRRFEGCAVLLAVDRLDYTKGIPHRLRTFRRLLRQSPHLRERVVLVQVAVPSRERVRSYRRLSDHVSELVGEINGEFGTPGWTPISYIRRAIPQAELASLYSIADLGWVTPLRDGMNLVAKEYVACQRGGAGVLVLSEFAGAAAEMGEAFLVNPYDEARTADVIQHALALPEDERRERMVALLRRVRRNDVFAWTRRFLDQLRQAGDERARRPPDPTGAVPVVELQREFEDARRRLVFLDYDGTLVPFAPRPRQAVPPGELLALVESLASDPRTLLTIVSGRARRDLEEWFGHVPRLWLAAEHGALVRPPGTRGWELLRPALSGEWKARVLPVLEDYADRAPGSFVEEKEYALVWHHRLSDPVFSEWLANELVAALGKMLAETELRAMRGNKTVEVRFAWAHKGEVLTLLEAGRAPFDFRMAIGDDRTDEDLFERLAAGWTIKVGPGATRARYRMRGWEDVRALLLSLAPNPAGSAQR